MSIVLCTALLTIVFTYMTLWYALARLTKRYDVVDSAWGLGFVLVAWVSLLLWGHFGMLQVISAALVSAWGLRLFGHIGNRNWRKHEDDHRYQAMSGKWGDSAARKMYTNVFLLQGALIILVSSPVLAIASVRHTPNAISWAGWAIWLFGIVFEAIADRQLATFIGKRAKGSHAIMNRGLWQYSRHPNYFGEVTSWWGAAIVACSAGAWWGVFGALLITVLITRVSGVPPLEKHYDGNKDYEAYRKRTSVFIPLPQRKSR